MLILNKILNYTKQLSFLCPLLIGLVLLFVALIPGLKTTSDSFLYRQGAEYLFENGFEGIFQQKVFLAKPVLFSLFLIPFVNKLYLLKIVHMVIYCTSFYLVNLLLRLYIEDHLYRWIYNLLFVLSTVIIMDHVFVWTEPLFLMLLLLYLLKLYQNFESISKWKLVALTVTGLSLCLLKHVGIFFVIFPAAMTWIYCMQKKEKPAILWLSSIQLVVPVFYFLIWHFLVWEYGGNPNRIDHFSGVDFIGNYQLISKAITSWFFIPVISKYVGCIFLPVMLTFLFLTIRLSTKRSIRWFLLASLVTVGIYLIILFTKGDMIFSDDDRYVSLIYPIIMLLLVGGVEKMTNLRPKIKPHLLILSGVFIVYNLVRVVKNVWFWSEL